MNAQKFTIGFDVGKVADPSAIAVVEELTAAELKAIRDARIRRMAQAIQQVVTGKPPRPIAPLQIRMLEQLPLGMSYPDQVRRLLNYIRRPPLLGNCELVVDRTGVGIAVLDIIEEQLQELKLDLDVVAVTLHGGKDTLVVTANKDYHVPKAELITSLQISMQQHIIEASRGVPNFDVLEKELKDYRSKLSQKSATETFNAREGAHDDIVLALAIANWRRRPPGGAVHVSGLGMDADEFVRKMAAERAAYEAIGLQHPLDLRAKDIQRERAEEAQRLAKLEHLTKPDPKVDAIRAELAEFAVQRIETNRRRSITQEMSALEVISIMSEGNAGAREVLARLMGAGGIGAALDLDDMDIRGGLIVAAWADYANGRVDTLRQGAQRRDPALVRCVNLSAVAIQTGRRAVPSGASSARGT